MESKSVKVFTSENSPRLSYVISLILGDILGIGWEAVTDRRKLGKHPVINYSSEKIAGSFRIQPSDLLFERGISAREIRIMEWKNLPVLFPSDNDADLPFDIFSASFYLVSRYEEYLEPDTDNNGRFSASSSIAYRNGFLSKPVIEHWSKELARGLLRKFPSLTFKRNDFCSVVTFDVDIPLIHRGKNLFSSIGGMLRDLASGDGHAGDKENPAFRDEKNAYEGLEYIKKKTREFHSDCRFFFSVGDHSKSGRNTSWKNEEYRKLIKTISSEFMSGLHLSPNAATNIKMLGTEYFRLRSVLGSPVAISRFHHVRFILPDSYRNLPGSGLTEDYSLGYPEEPGFRASIARPFIFYDLIHDTQTSLRLVPFQVMDTFIEENRQKAGSVIQSLIEETKKAGGTFVSAWHNTSLQLSPECRENRIIFETMLRCQLV
jgi:hypothetical protein